MANHDNRITIDFIINGQDFPVTANVEAPLLSAVEKALSESGNTGRRNPEEWEVRNADGALLQMHQKIEALSLGNNAKLFLSLGVGGGGDSH